MKKQEKSKGKMSVSEAGRRGGLKTSETHGRDFYRKIGKQGGSRVRELIQAGKQRESPEEEDTMSVEA
jgi:general stress protein YciG